MMSDDVEFGGADDVFAEIESDPLADQGPPPGVEEAELPGDNPTAEEIAAAEAAEAQLQPGEVLEEPEEPDNDPEPELPGEAEAAAAAAEPEPAPAPEAVPDPEPQPQSEESPEPVPEATPEPEPQPEPTPPVEKTKPAAEPTPVAEAPGPTEEVPEEPAAEEPKKEPKKKGGKKGKRKAKKAAKKEKGTRATVRDYAILYEIEGGWGPSEPIVVTARSVKKAKEAAFPELEKATGQKAFSNVVAVPVSNWNPEPLKGDTEVRSVISIG